ncbi:PAS-domain containing protein [Bosea sp. 685]|uniref:PAS-domain containing protein n=1 Tax=Bosea sp. 685 TaxID=3080057 RepID=UPI002892C130|nr:PAS-domain containing protein [Bosea sp. 685]WNJ89973.1 PAS-domain containing protein [Bosea sp. 685]
MPAILIGVILASVLLLSVTGWLVWQSRQRAIQTAVTANESLVSVLERHAAQMIDPIRIVLKTAGQQLGPAPGDRSRHNMLDAWLADVARDLPQLRAVGVFDTSNGTSVYQFIRSRDPSEAALKAFATAASRLTGDGVQIGDAVFDDASGHWLLPIGSAIPPRQGIGGHIVMALVSLDHLQELYASLDTGPNGTVVLFHSDGSVLVRHPYDPSRVGQNIQSGSLFGTHLSSRNSGTFQAHSSIDGVERIISFRRLEAAPLVAVVSRSVTDVLAKWRQELSVDFTVSGLCAVALLGLGLLLIRVAQERDKSSSYLDVTLAHMEQGLLMVGPNQRTKVYNRRALELLDLPEELMARRPHSTEVFAYQVARGEFAETPNDLHGKIIRQILSETPHCYERTRPNGTVLEIRTTPLPDGGAVRTYTDITEHRRAIDDMNASTAFANSLINSSPDCIQLLDLDGRVTFISDLGQELFEIQDFEAIRGRPFADFFAKEHRSRIELALRRVRDGQTDRFTRMCPTLGGVVKWWEFIITPVHEIGRGPERLFVVARDMSAQQAHAEELSRAKEAAERASLAKTQFLASMSHEIRTPLNAILGFATLARERQGHDQELRRQIELIQKAGEALLTIINDVLDLSKIEAGKVELEERPLDLRGLVSDCLSLTHGLATLKGLALDCVVDPAIPARVIADEARLRQILLNLLNNAVKFTPSGSVSLSVTPAPQAGHMVLAVSDTGIGIAADRLPHLFQDFVQVDGSISRQFGGTGLGLSISRRLAVLMGGEIGASSVFGQGSIFQITLPITEAGIETPPSAAIETPSAITATPRRILLVDDLSINLEIVGAMLAKAGHHVSFASSGPNAISAYREQRHDMILMDVQMPDMDGLETTRHIRELDAQGRSVPVIALTANVFSQQIASYRRAGMNDHLGKPFRRATLLAMIDRWTGDGAPIRASRMEIAAAAPMLDQDCQDELARLIGTEKVLELLTRLAEDLPRRLRSAASDALRADAHVMVSTAGLLGFAQLSATARELEQAIDAEDDIAPPLAQLLAVRTATMQEMRTVMSRLAPDMEFGSNTFNLKG